MGIEQNQITLPYIGHKMEKMYSAKLVYRNFFEYLFKSIFNKKYLILLSVSFFSLFIIFYSIKALLYSINLKQLSFLNENDTLALLEIVIYVFPVGFVLSIIVSLIFWHQKFYIDGHKIIDISMGKNELEIRLIEKVILITPKLAHIIFKANSGKLYTVSYWHGRVERDWLEFLELLISHNPSIEDKIFISIPFYTGNKLKKSSVVESYSEILKIFNK